MRPSDQRLCSATSRPRYQARIAEREDQQQAGARSVVPGDGDPAVRDDREAGKIPRVGDLREHAKHDHQHARGEEECERDVADRLDVDRRQLPDDPVRRQPADTDQRSEHGGGNDRHHRHPQGVEESLDQRVPDRCALRQRVPRDLERRRIVEEVEARRDVLAGGVLRVVAVQPDDDGDRAGHDDQLGHPLENVDVPPERNPSSDRCGHGADRCSGRPHDRRCSESIGLSGTEVRTSDRRRSTGR